MKPLKESYEHRKALILEFGHDPFNVKADGFTSEGFYEVCYRLDGEVIIADNCVVTTFIRWPDESWRARAAKAIYDDWEETLKGEA